LYAGIPIDTYHHGWRYPSKSTLDKIIRSEMHARYAWEHPEETEAMIFGSALHTAVLEPVNFLTTYVRAEQCQAQTQAKKQCSNMGKMFVGGEWKCSRHIPVVTDIQSASQVHGDARIALDESDFERIKEMIASLQAHKRIYRMLCDNGRAEMSGVFDDPITGVRCKFRPDWINEHPLRRCVVDLKTTADASPAGARSSIFAFGYHRQAAMILQGLASIPKPIHVERFIFIFMEKEPPYAVAAYGLEDDTLARGRAECTALLRRYRRAKKLNRFEGYGDRIGELSLARWDVERSDAIAASADNFLE
jgi:hypothetical protein